MQSIWQVVVHARLEPEQKPKSECSDSEVRVAPCKNDVKQQQDWRPVFVDRPGTYGITDDLDELMGENVGFDMDLLSQKYLRLHA